MSRIAGFTGVACLMLMAAFAALGAEVTKNQFHVQGGKLKKGTEDYQFQAIEIPRLVRPCTSADERMRAVNNAAAAGARAVCFDLYCPGSQSATLSEEIVATALDLNAKMLDRNMAMTCRVFGEGSRKGWWFRRRAVAAAAKAFKNSNDMVFILDNKKAAKRFQRLAPGVIVAAPEGAPVHLIKPGGECHGGMPVLLDGAMPNAGNCLLNYIMPPGEESLAAFEAAMAEPIESQPWAPDNSVLSEQERAEGWISLFDGKTLDGWSIQGANKEGFAVTDGTIEWKSKGASYLRTRDRYDNFILRLEWKIEEGGNSGIFLRAPRVARCSRIGMEFQLFGTQEPPHKNGVGAIYDVLPPLVNGSKPAGEWNELEITLNGPMMKAVLNGQVVQDVNLDENDELRPRLRNGFIGLQDHGNYVVFRNIRIKKL